MLDPTNFFSKTLGHWLSVVCHYFTCVLVCETLFIFGFLRDNKINLRRCGRVGGGDYNQAFQILKVNIFIAVSLP